MEESDLLTEILIKRIESMNYDVKNRTYRFMEKMETVKKLAKFGEIPKGELGRRIEQVRLNSDELMLLLLLYNKIMQENKDNQEAS